MMMVMNINIMMIVGMEAIIVIVTVTSNGDYGAGDNSTNKCFQPANHKVANPHVDVRVTYTQFPIVKWLSYNTNLSFSYECSTQNIGLWRRSSGCELVFNSSNDTTWEQRRRKSEILAWPGRQSVDSSENTSANIRGGSRNF